MRFKRLSFVLPILLVVSLLLAACGGEQQPQEPTPQPTATVEQAVATPVSAPPVAAPATPVGVMPVAAPATPVPAPLDFGKAEYKDPDQAKVVPSAVFGEVPVDQIIVMLAEGQSRADAERVAADLGGVIVGEIEFINLFQIETTTGTEAEMLAAVKQAQGLAGVVTAFPNARMYSVQSACKACGPLNDSFYDGDRGRAYETIGMQAAWDVIKASGIPLNNVIVGVMDSALYTKSDDIGGRARISGLGANDSTDQPAKNKAGQVVRGGYNHGTMVTHVIAANADNGGPAGIASVLGDKLRVNVTNIFTSDPDLVEAKPDPSDPTKVVWTDGKTYVFAPFVHALRQIQNGATVINCSFGPDKPHADNKAQSDAYKAFLQKMQVQHPHVLFVAAAGNEKDGLDGSNYSIGGHKLPNLITVGALDDHGNRASFSNYATGEGEVTISAPGVEIPVAMAPDGTPVRSNGTSFSAPMVAAAAAMLRSINPKLEAADIKRILEETSAPGVVGETESILIPPGMGRGVLRVDDAVLRVINDLRKAEGKPPLDKDALRQLTIIEGSATSETPRDFTIIASLPAVSPSGTAVKIDVRGTGSMLVGATTQTLSSPGEVTWGLSLIDESARPMIRLCRLDSDSCCDLFLEDEVDLAGLWLGTLTYTRLDMPQEITIPHPFDDDEPPHVITKEQCEEGLDIGVPKPFGLEFHPYDPSSGVLLIKLADNDDDSDEDDEEEWIPYSFSGGRMTVNHLSEQFGILFMVGTVTTSDTEYTMEGLLRIVIYDTEGFTAEIEGTFVVSKPRSDP